MPEQASPRQDVLDVLREYDSIEIGTHGRSQVEVLLDVGARNDDTAEPIARAHVLGWHVGSVDDGGSRTAFWLEPASTFDA